MVDGRIVVAGRRVDDPVKLVEKYLRLRRRTAVEFDGAAGTFDEVNRDLIASTRIVRSRISRDQGEWFVERARTAPWHLVPPTLRLVEALPDVVDGPYDGAISLWRYFRNDENIPSRVSTAKISKVLHAMRPQYFPMLDSRVMRRYRRMAAEEAGRIKAIRPELGEFGFAYWAAIRNDLEQSAEGLSDLRLALLELDDTYINVWAKHVSDVRLHDVLAWS
jgi:hypothetical protein